MVNWVSAGGCIEFRFEDYNYFRYFPPMFERRETQVLRHDVG